MSTTVDESMAQPAGASGDGAGCPANTWRTVAISVLVAVVLSVSATLLFAGIFHPSGTGQGAPLASVPGADCCRQPAVR